MRPGPIGVIGAFILLALHSLLVWLVILLGTLAWVFSLQGLRTPEVTLGAFLGWIDNNLLWLLVQGPFAWSFPNAPVKWVPARDRASVAHRVRFKDVF